MPTTLRARACAEIGRALPTAFFVASLGALVLAEATPAVAQSSASPLGRADLVVTSDWLRAHLGDRNLVLLHVGERAEYDAEHIPGARFARTSSISTPPTRDPGALSLEMLPADELRGRLEALGISDDSRVVVYFGSDWATPATRVLLTLHYAGLGARASLLDGGMPAWKKGGGAVTAEPVPERRGTLTPRPIVPLVVDAEWVRGRLRTPGISIVDARSPVYYDGPPANGQRRGHLPGAVSIPFSSVFDEAGFLLPRERLAELFRAAGVKPNDTVVAYCHIGQQATAVLLAARALGHEVRLYDGSFQDWSRRSELPVESSRGGAREER